MATLRDTYQEAGDDYDDGNAEEGWGAAFAAGPEFGAQEPANVTAGQGSEGYETPSYELDEGGYAPGPASGASYVANSPSRAGAFTGQEANSAANYPKSFNWATPYSAAQKSGVTTGLKSGITTSQKPYATVTTSKTVYPKGAQFPTFQGPKWDEGELKKRTQKAAAPGLRSLEMKVQQAMARYYENPNVRRMVLRDTLAGYGIGISNIRAQAERTARADYSADYSRMYSEAMGTYQRDLTKLQEQATKVSSQQQVYTKSEYDKLTGGNEKLETLA